VTAFVDEGAYRDGSVCDFAACRGGEGRAPQTSSSALRRR
jgi:hypothetical protein